MLSCQQVSDWQLQHDNTFFSRSLQAYRKLVSRSTSALRSLYLVEPTSSTQMPHMTCFSDVSQLPPELSSVPQSLWAAHKYDVGLITGAEPIQITPKSDFRPNQPQYPLKPEAVEGITPVFNSLLEAGVIVPCEDSPVRTPMFPVKKVRPPPQKDDWRFVQDLRAVNAAVHARAPKFRIHIRIFLRSHLMPIGSQWLISRMLFSAFQCIQTVNTGLLFNSMANHTPSPASVKAIVNRPRFIMKPYVTVCPPSSCLQGLLSFNMSTTCSLLFQLRNSVVPTPSAFFNIWHVKATRLACRKYSTARLRSHSWDMSSPVKVVLSHKTAFLLSQPSRSPAQRNNLCRFWDFVVIVEVLFQIFLYLKSL